VSLVGLVWFRLHSTFGRRWGSYVVVVLLIGLLGGIAMGSVSVLPGRWADRTLTALILRAE
jgi:hypothetical protein